MDVLPRFIRVLRAEDRTKCEPQCERLESVPWSEADWDRLIVDNLDLVADCLKAAELIREDSKLRLLGRQIDNVDIVLAEVTGHNADVFLRLILVEDKLLRNPEAKRHVLAQLVDYADHVQNVWDSPDIVQKLARTEDNGWLAKHVGELRHGIKRGDFLLLVMGDRIDERLERLARRFAAHDNPLTLSELAMVSMPLYKLDESRLLLVPHVVSSVQRRERELTIRVTVRDIQGTRVEAEIAHSSKADEPGRTSYPIRDEVRAFLKKVAEKTDPLLPHLTSAKNPRKSLEYQQAGQDGTSVLYRVHFGGYVRDEWSPILVGVTLIANDEQRRDQLAVAMGAQRDLLPAATNIKKSGKQTLEALTETEWNAPEELDVKLVDDITRQMKMYVGAMPTILGHPKL